VDIEPGRRTRSRPARPRPGPVPLAVDELPPDQVPGPLRRDHGHIDVSRRLDQAVPDVQAVAEDERLAGRPRSDTQRDASNLIASGRLRVVFGGGFKHP
jgi:hypothetical protein